MNHKRRRPKASRAGCLLCKPHKLGKGAENDTSVKARRDEIVADAAIRAWNARGKG